MATTDKAVEILKETLANLESGLAGKTADINKQYKEAVALAKKNHKEALSIAERSKKAALEEFSNDKAEIIKLKNALKALASEPKAESVKAKDRITDWAGKLSEAVTKTGKTVSNLKPKEVKKALTDLYPDVEFTTASFNNAWLLFKKK